MLADARVEGGGRLLQQLVEVHPQPLPQVLQMSESGTRKYSGFLDYGGVMS